MKPKPPAFYLAVSDADARNPVPIDNRLRAFLKVALRAFGLRVAWARATEPPQVGEQPAVHAMQADRRSA